MNYENCDITIKAQNGVCLTFTAKCASVGFEKEYVDVQSCDSLVATRMLVGIKTTLKAESYPKLCEPLQPCDPPKKPGLLKRFIRIIV